MKYLTKRLLMAIVALAVLLGAAWLAFTQGPLAPPKVELAEVRQGDLHPGVFGIGNVEARYLHALGGTLAGRVKNVNVDQGDRVKAGQVLAELEPVDIDDRIQSAAHSVQRSGMALQEAEAKLQEAISHEQIARANALRYRDLEKKQFVSKEMADTKASEAEVAKAATDAARAAVDAARREIARLGSDRQGLVKQRINLKLISPVDGVVVAREAEPGNTVVAGQAVLRVADPAQLWVRTRIDQNQSGAIAVGQAASIVLRSRQDVPLPGKVARIEVQGDAVSEEILVDVTFDSMPPRLILGELAEVTITLPTARDVLFVPAAAIRKAGQHHGVWLADDNKVRFQPVKTGISTLDGHIQVTHGLNAGDRVVLYSPVELQEGARIKVTKLHD